MMKKITVSLLFFVFGGLSLLALFPGCGGGKKQAGGLPAGGTPPVVTTTTPADKSINVPLNPLVSALFDQSLDSTTIDTTSFSLSDGAEIVKATVAYDAPNRTVV